MTWGERIFRATIYMVVTATWLAYFYMALEYIGQQIDYSKVVR